MSLPKQLKTEKESTVRQLSRSYLAELEKDDSDLRNLVNKFLISIVNQVFLIETFNSRLGAKRIVQILKQLNGNEENHENLKPYLSEENQTFLGWEGLISLVSVSEVFSSAKQLFVCEFSNVVKIGKESSELLNKVIGHLKMSPTKKCILITSKPGLLDDQMKELEKKTFLKFNEPKNNLTSEIYKNNDAALIGRAEKGHLNDLEELIRNGVDVNTTDHLGRTALHAAAESGQKEVIISLLRHGAKIVPDKEVNLPLHVAAKKGHVDVVLTFFKNDVDVDSPGKFGYTALHLAAKEGHNYVVKTLLEIGADINAKDNNGWTVLYSAARNRRNDVVKTLLENGADVNAKDNHGRTLLHLAAQNGHNDVVKTLLENGADVNAKTKNNKLTVLYSAAQNGHNDVVKTLLENGADVNAKDNGLWTALHSAAHDGHNDVVKTLLENGADVNAKSKFGLTALYSAAHKGTNDVVKTLLKNGADVNAKDSDGWTVLHRAARNGHNDVVKTLLENGADANIKDNDNKTPLDIAQIRKDQKVVELLRKKMSKKLDT